LLLPLLPALMQLQVAWHELLSAIASKKCHGFVKKPCGHLGPYLGKNSGSSCALLQLWQVLLLAVAAAAAA